MKCCQHHVFERSGIAAQTDLESPDCKDIFKLLEAEQALFLESEHAFRSDSYQWPRDPLHTWSRVWEYPYVFHHLRKLRLVLSTEKSPIAVDLGSGVTFFPFSIAHMGFEVVCADIDKTCERDIKRAIKVVPSSPGKVSFRLIEGTRLPFDDSEVDVIFCISLLEHIPDFVTVVSEVFRILRNGGIFLLTIDLDLRGDSELGIESYRRLTASLKQDFEYLYPNVTIHPADMLNSLSGPYPYQRLHGLKRARFLITQKLRTALLNKRSVPEIPYFLSVEGMALRKR